MTRIPQNETLVPREYVENLLRASAPERAEDLKTLWDKYQPEFYMADDGAGAMLSANKKRVVFYLGRARLESVAMCTGNSSLMRTWSRTCDPA